MSAEVQRAYDEWAPRYDTDPNPTRDLNATVLRQQPFHLAGKMVLEIGCGTGSNTIWLADRARRVVAIDLAEGMLRRARQRLGTRPIDWLRVDLTKPWPLAPGFDLILATSVLEHVYDLTGVFTQVYHGLRSGGLLYSSELHPYKQLQGSQARYQHPETGTLVLIPAFRHGLSEYINAGIEVGFVLRHMGEWQHPSDGTPRLMTLLFERP